MHLETVVQVMRAFTPNRFKRLKQFMHSRYFRAPKPVVALFDSLARQHPHFEPAKLSPESIAGRYKSLSTPLKQRQAGVKLLRYLKDFIALTNWETDTHHIFKNRLEGLQQMKLGKLFMQEYHEAMQYLSHPANQTPDSFYYRHLFTGFSVSGAEVIARPARPGELEPVLATLDEFSAIQKLRYTCEIISRSRSSTSSAMHPDALNRLLAPYARSSQPYIQTLVHICKMLNARTYSSAQYYYHIIKNNVKRQRSKLSTAAIESNGYAINQCLYWRNLGYEQAEEEYLWWLELKVENNLLLIGDEILPVTFRNIAIIVAENRQTASLEKFIDEYENHLPAPCRRAYVNFARTLLCYCRQQYTRAVRLLATVSLKNEVIFNCLVKRWLWICLYECNCSDTDTLENQLRSFALYVNRHTVQLNGNHPVFHRFIAHARKLLRGAPVNLSENESKILKEEGNFSGKKWLAQKLETRNLSRQRLSLKP